MSEQWAKAATKEQLVTLLTNHEIPYTLKMNKLGMVKKLQEHGVERVSTKRKATEGPSGSTKRTKTRDIARLVAKVKTGLDEPLEIHAGPSSVAGLCTFDGMLIDSNNVVIGKLGDDGSTVVMLDHDDVEKSVGHRIDYDKLRIVCRD